MTLRRNGRIASIVLAVLETPRGFCRTQAYHSKDRVGNRAASGPRTASQLGQSIQSPLFADPLFAGDPGVAGKPADKSGFSPDRMMEPGLKLDFDSFFATNPELLQRGIGLQREAFKDLLRKPSARASSDSSLK